MSEANKPEEKKIIIDDDWKDQVAAEKEALKKEAQEKEGTEGKAQPAEAGGQEPFAMPPASFELLVSSLATEAMMALGQFPNPAGQDMPPNPGLATYAIDMLAVLAEKTQGNLSPEEDKMLSDLLHQLRMMFIAVQQGGAGA